MVEVRRGEEAIKELFGLSATRYYQVLNALVDRPEALAADPMLVGGCADCAHRARSPRCAPSGIRPLLVARRPAIELGFDDNRTRTQPSAVACRGDAAAGRGRRFFGLGAHHLATSGDSDAPAPTTTASPTVAQRTTSAPTTTVEASSTRVCVVNAGSVSGPAGSVTQELKARATRPPNRQTCRRAR